MTWLRTALPGRAAWRFFRELLLPPLESPRFFEAAARHQGFVRAAEELGVTPAAVAHRVRMLEEHLGAPLFGRRHRGVRLNRRGQACLKEVQRILAEVHGVSERQRRWPRRVRIVSVEAVAEKWLVRPLATFKAAHPGVALELGTNHRGVDPGRRDFDAWLACTGETAAPRPVTRREDTVLEETLYEEDLLPVCSPALLAAQGAAAPLRYARGVRADVELARICCRRVAVRALSRRLAATSSVRASHASTSSRSPGSRSLSLRNTRQVASATRLLPSTKG